MVPRLGSSFSCFGTLLAEEPPVLVGLLAVEVAAAMDVAVAPAKLVDEDVPAEAASPFCCCLSIISRFFLASLAISHTVATLK